MKFFKPFTPSYKKKENWYKYWDARIKNYAYINDKKVNTKEKYGRVDTEVLEWWENLFMETLSDYEDMSENSCMYCNTMCKQYWTHEDSWLIHLCLPCLILDKVTILLEKIITWWESRKDRSWEFTFFTCA